MAALAHPGKQLLAAELTIAVDAHAHPFGQQRQRGAQKLLLVSQSTLSAMGQRKPGQWERASAKTDAYHQNVVDIAQQDAVDQQLHPLPFQAVERQFGDRLIVFLLRDTLVSSKRRMRCSLAAWVVSSGIARASFPIWAETLWLLATTSNARVSIWLASAFGSCAVNCWDVLSYSGEVGMDSSFG
ncbi:hypothetical protein [Kouleothrix sp.]|uniref:hypothetical protein n=1 Tax=Kouleothrix sp. TaxID=2779161 RepID=UPI003919F1D2